MEFGERNLSHEMTIHLGVKWIDNIIENWICVSKWMHIVNDKQMIIGERRHICRNNEAK